MLPIVDKSNFICLPTDMAEDTVTSKRLIISGLTPSIDANALSQRLSSFGEVHSLVGVGMLDANGEDSSLKRNGLGTIKRTNVH